MVWCKTLRIVISDESKNNYQFLKENYILALWHGQIFGLLYYLRNTSKLNILVSPSSDGDFLANLGKLLGYIIIRGSSFKRTVPATRSILKALRRKEGVVLVGDGSRGPRYKFQPGSLLIASRTGSYLVPMVFDANWKTQLNSWDRFLIPWPFSKCVFSLGNPIFLPSDIKEGELQKAQKDLESKLNSMTKSCFAKSQGRFT
jgi:lysophospholipid acyltransferase (LPLAT)-like uncharacterized protein